ncbi:MAG: hypothetical protein IMZ46_12945, partial [Acidobacteria bacterium]|nr:hypothetical protein [Acidobacteriota bacterium]
RAVRVLEPGKEKLRDDWKTLWGQWDECIAESGREDGKYTYQEAHWEPPYLDLDGVMQDLEQIARRMHELLARVWDENLHPELSFADATAAAALEIGAGLPEWIQPVDAGQFGRQTTACLLEWQWRTAQREGVGALEYIGRIRVFEQSLGAALDQDSIAALVTMFDAADQRKILLGLAEHRQQAPWADVLSEPRSGWFRLYQRLARKWDRKLFADACRNNIAQDFTLALPLLTERLRSKGYAEALTLLDDAVRAMLRLNAGETWDPRGGLLVRHREIVMRGGVQPAHVKLLGAWRKVAAGLGQQDVSCALDLQLVVATRRDDWDAVLAAFRDASPACEPLFADWRADASERSIGASGWMDKSTEPAWVHWLVDAARAGNAAIFLEPVREWLADSRAEPAAAGWRRSAFATLAVDVDGAGDLERRCPTLHRLLSRERAGMPECDGVRRRWVERLGGFDLFADVVAFCKSHARALVPDPGAAHGSNYEDCAEWIAGILELDPAAYGTILAAWSVAHKRRRNLWRALAAKRPTRATD